MKEAFPELHQAIHEHVDEYGWLRTQGYRYEPLSPEALVYRIQLAVLRWSTDAVREAARREAAPVAEEVLGFPPSEILAGYIAAVQAMVSQRVFRVDVYLQAECIARPLIAKIAEALESTTNQVLFASVQEIEAGLARGENLPIQEINLRAGNGFTVQGEDDAFVVDANDAPAIENRHRSSGTGLTGMTACRGTAVGRVRIILDQEELLRLETGDVLVTAASTIDPTDATGETTVFPTRSGGPYSHALERVAAVVADEGGLLSHAAIVCRERGLPSVLGTEFATTSLFDGQVVEVDATKPVGIVIPL
jgi:phosphohistidine swiveling domain-containing protein